VGCQPLVTISASYGAGGSRVGPLLAERLDVAFAARLVLPGIADRLEAAPAVPGHDDEPVGRSLGRLLRQLTGERPPAAPLLNEASAIADAEYRRVREQEILALVDGGAVILGRAAAVVLRDVPQALHVRMCGPRELRIEQAMVVEGIDGDAARWRQATEDLARDAYVRHFYGVDPLDAKLYHLVIDSTRLSLDACVEAIAAAALAVA